MGRMVSLMRGLALAAALVLAAAPLPARAAAVGAGAAGDLVQFGGGGAAPSDSGIAAANVTPSYGINLAPANLPALRKCLSAIDGGTRTTPCLVIAIGDSLTEGYIPSGGTTLDKTAYTSVMARVLDGRPDGAGGGLRVDYDGFIGDGTNGGGAISYRNALWTGMFTSFAGGWTDATGGWPYAFFENTGSAGNFTVQPVKAADTCTLWTHGYAGSGLGALHAQFGTGSAVTVDENTSAGALTTNLLQTTVSAASLGVQALTLTWSSGGVVYVLGADCYDSTHPGISIVNAGAYGSEAATWGSVSNLASGGAMNDIAAIAPAACLIQLGGSDMVINGATAATTAAFLNSIIGACQGAGADAVLIADGHSNSGSFSDTSLGAVTAMQYGVANANPQGPGHVPLWDLFGAGVSWSYWSGEGWTASDNTHYSPAGYAFMGRFEAQEFCTMLGCE